MTHTSMRLKRSTRRRERTDLNNSLTGEAKRELRKQLVLQERREIMSRYWLVLLMSVILGGHLVSAQVTTGTISGVVQDSSGAVTPGVSVTVRNLDTGIARSVTTDERGRYTATNLTLG